MRGHEGARDRIGCCECRIGVAGQEPPPDPWCVLRQVACLSNGTFRNLPGPGPCHRGDAAGPRSAFAEFPAWVFPTYRTVPVNRYPGDSRTALKGSPVRERNCPDVGDSVAVVEEVGENGVETLWSLIATHAAGQGRQVPVAGVCAVAVSCVQGTGRA